MNCSTSLTVISLLLSESGHLLDSWSLSTWPLPATDSHPEPPYSQQRSKFTFHCTHSYRIMWNGIISHTVIQWYVVAVNKSSLLCREMWQYLGQVATFISNVGKVLRKMPSSEKGLVRQSLSSATRRYSSSSKRARTPRTESKAMPFITGDDGRLLPGACNFHFLSCDVSCDHSINCRGSAVL